ncbi:MAG: histidinol-phosphate aminotransferase family protein, partial [Planctomycetes bacterium]|nr:histidinol-phosphate aminotransferase family protein [Planctomycetota bacterium]
MDTPARRIRLATEADRKAIYSLRHEIYAAELNQHPQNEQGLLTDGLDSFNEYILFEEAEGVIGFVSITPPGHGAYSLDKYMARDEFPFPCDGGLFEIRILTVLPGYRGSFASLLLMFAALRWTDCEGGTRVMAIGRSDLLGLYAKTGLQPHGNVIQSGALTFELMSASIETLRERADHMRSVLERAQEGLEWELPFPAFYEAPCFHGGQFFESVGVGFEDLSRRKGIVNADVLDAWFPPAPLVLDTLREHLHWVLGTSPPTHCEGMIAAIAKARDVRADCIVPGAGSSDLIYAVLPSWLRPSSRVLILDPMYGEYAFILQERLRCQVDRLHLHRARNYDVDLDELRERIASHYDLIVLVNPNSPTGRHIPAADLRRILAEVPERTRVWVDETYVDYVGPGESLERFATTRPNIVVCKSMSKAYGLSGVRAAYLCTNSTLARELRASMPPWSVSLPGQIAAVKALESEAYYRKRWSQTSDLWEQLAIGLRALGLDVVRGVANFMLCHLPQTAPTAATLVAELQRDGIFIRDVPNMGQRLGDRTIRIAVKDRESNQRVLDA